MSFKVLVLILLGVSLVFATPFEIEFVSFTTPTLTDDEDWADQEWADQDWAVQDWPDQDWADLGRYAASDAQLSVLPAGTNQVVFMGDSITDSWTLTQYFPGKPYVNRGISGQTTPQMLVRFRPDDIELQPAATIILAGTNDLANNTGYEPIPIIEGNLMSMAELALLHGIKVIMASLLPVCGSIVATRPPALILELNEFIKSYCEANGHIYLDYFSSMVDSNGLFQLNLTNDCLHPNDVGYQVMAPLAEAAIEQALKY